MGIRNLHKNFLEARGVFILLLFFVSADLFSATYYTRGAGGNWSAPATWSNTSCNGLSDGTIPGAGDDVIICNSFGGLAVAVIVDGAYSCNNLTVGDAASDATVQITGAGNSLSIAGDLQINPGNNGNNYLLDAGPGTININGTFSAWGTSGINNIQLSTGAVTFVPLVNMSNAAHYITFTSTGTINFNSGFTCNQSQARFITVAGCTVNFLGSYTQSGPKNKWNAASLAVFNCAGCLIDNSSGVDLGHVIIYDNASVSTAGAGKLNIAGYLTLNTNSTFTTTKNIPGDKATAKSIDDVTLMSGSTFNLTGGPGLFIQSQGSWINNGGTLNGGTYTVQFEGIGNSIGGTSSTTFPDLQFGNTLNNVNYTLNQNITCANLIFDADNSSRTLTHTVANALTVTGNVTMNQPTLSPKTNLWDIASGSATIGGNFIFVGTNNTVDRICKVNVSSGSLSFTGNVTWMANAVEPTEIISLGTGVMTFANSLSMPQRSGTFNVTGSGTVNFNGAAAPSFNLNATNGGAPNAVFTTSSGSIINFTNGFTNDNAPVILADGSNAVFTGSGTITPTAAITFGNVQINGGTTVTLAGNIGLTNNWTNLGGTFTPGTNTVTFSGTSTQTITKAGGETFYNLTSNKATGLITLASAVTVTNLLTMTAGNYNLNANTLTLGNAAASTLTYTAGIMYGGTFSRWWLSATAVTSTSGNYYGLFPVGSSLDYRPVEINSTASPTAAGYISVSHTDAITSTDGSWAANDGLGSTVQRMHDMRSIISNGTVTGGTYNLDVSFTALSSVGALADMRLMPYLAAGIGTHAAATGSVSSPTVKRTALTIAQLPNTWAIGTINKDPVTGTPLRPPYYSRKTGDWNDATVGNATWSLSPQVPGPQPSCDCIPTAGSLVVISSGNTVTLNVNSSPDYLIIENTASLIGTNNLTVGYDVQVQGTGSFSPTAGTWAISRNLTFTGASASSTTPSATTTVGSELNLAAGTTLTLNQALTVSGNLILDGIIAAGANAISLNGAAKSISGTGSITGSGTLTVTNNKSVLAGSNLTIAPVFALAAATTVTNNGTITLSRNLTGTDAATSIWTNAANSVLNAAGSVLSTGVLNASASPNTVNYNGAGAQTVKVPTAGVTYYNLTLSNTNNKTAAGAFAIAAGGILDIQNSVIFIDGGFAITGGGGLTMSGTSQYRITNSTNPVPSLTGAYNLTGGLIMFARAGAQTIRSIGLNGPAPAAYYQLRTDGTGIKALAGPITVQSHLTIAGSSRLNVTGSNHAINLKGNWSVTSTDADPFIQQIGTVSLTGTVQQTISSVLAGGETFYNLTVNNSTISQAIQLNSPINVSNTLSLTDGHILTTATNLLTMAGTAGVSLLSTPQDSSFVKGPMAYNITSSLLRTYPIGKDNDYRMVELLVNQSPSATYTVEMINSSAQALPYTLPGTIDWVSGIRYFTVSQSSSSGFTNAQFRTWFQCTQNNDYVNDLPNLKIVQSDNPVSGNWQDRGVQSVGGFICGGLSYYGDILSTSFTSFHAGSNKFALANSSGGSNPLPVELLTFDAKPNGNVVDVTWKTASEINSDYFMVQHSKDGLTFYDVEKVNAAGNSSSPRNYYSVDYEPYDNISYYRLKQVDNDGKTTFSNVVAVKFNNPDLISVYPNPTIGPFNVSIKAEKGEEVLIVVRDLLGKEFYSKVIVMANDKEVIAIDPSGKLAPGVYVVVATSNDTIYEKKLVIK